MLSFVPSPATRPDVFHPHPILSPRSRPNLSVRAHPTPITCTESLTDNPKTRIPILEGDLIAYRTKRRRPNKPNSKKPDWKVGAVMLISDDILEVAPVCVRNVADDGRVEIFINWGSKGDTALHSMQLHKLQVHCLDFDFEMRVIEDRVANPHGEESEECWRVDTNQLDALSLSPPCCEPL